MISLEKRALIGEVEARLYGKDGLLNSYRKAKNMTVTKGFQNVCEMMGQSTGQPPGFQYCAIGEGTNTPDISDTLLISEATIGLNGTRVQGGFERTADTIWKNDATFNANTATGTIRESGLFNNSTPESQTMLCRQTFGAITKGASDTLVVTWQYTLS